MGGDCAEEYVTYAERVEVCAGASSVHGQGLDTISLPDGDFFHFVRHVSSCLSKGEVVEADGLLRL